MMKMFRSAKLKRKKAISELGRARNIVAGLLIGVENAGISGIDEQDGLRLAGMFASVINAIATAETYINETGKEKQGNQH